MDFLLILVAIGGFVVSIVLLVLASRANRLQEESDVRVETLEALATGSVLFASSGPVSPDLVVQTQLRDERDGDDLDFALNEFADENEMPIATFAPAAAAEEPPSSGLAGFVTPLPSRIVPPAPAYPFVMTVPAAAGAGRVQISFDRNRSRSRS